MPLVEYVATFRAIRAPFLPIEDDSVALSESVFSADVLHRLPETDTTTAFPNAAPSFVFPSGATLLSAAPPQSHAFHSFVLTTQFGDRLYGHCFTRHVPVAPERRQELLPDTDDSSHYFEPIALVILSFHPFHNSFARILIDFGRYRWTRSIDSKELIQSLWRLLNCPAPHSNGDSIVHVRAAVHDVELQYPLPIQRPLADINFRVLFRLVDPKTIIDLFTALLCEVPVILLADAVDQLTPCLEALSSLLYPMKWPFIYIPVLPTPLTYLFQAPQSFLMGSLFVPDQELPDNAFIVHLNRSAVLSRPAFQALPWHLAWRLWDSILTHMNYFRHYQPHAPVLPPPHLPPHSLLHQHSSTAGASLSTPQSHQVVPDPARHGHEWTRSQMLPVQSSLLLIEKSTVTMLGRSHGPSPKHAVALAAQRAAVEAESRPSLFSSALAQFMEPRQASVLSLETANDLYSGTDASDNEVGLVSAQRSSAAVWVDPDTFDSHRVLVDTAQTSNVEPKPEKILPDLSNLKILQPPSGYTMSDASAAPQAAMPSPIVTEPSAPTFELPFYPTIVVSVRSQSKQTSDNDLRPVSVSVINESNTPNAVESIVSHSKRPSVISATRQRRLESVDSPIHPLGAVPAASTPAPITEQHESNQYTAETSVNESTSHIQDAPAADAKAAAASAAASLEADAMKLVCSQFRTAIQTGMPLYNEGRIGACKQIYCETVTFAIQTLQSAFNAACQLRQSVLLSPTVPHSTELNAVRSQCVSVLVSTLERLEAKRSDPSAALWSLRRAMDAVLVHQSMLNNLTEAVIAIAPSAHALFLAVDICRNGIQLASSDQDSALSIHESTVQAALAVLQNEPAPTSSQPSSASPSLDLLWAALHDARRQDDPTGVWTLRRAMNQLLHHETVLDRSLIIAPATPVVHESSESLDFSDRMNNAALFSSERYLALQPSHVRLQLGTQLLDRSVPVDTTPTQSDSSGLANRTNSSHSWSQATRHSEGPAVNVPALRDAFMSVFVSLLRGYREFIAIPSNVGDGASQFSPDRTISLHRSRRTPKADVEPEVVANLFPSTPTTAHRDIASTTEAPLNVELFDNDAFLQSADPDYRVFLRDFLNGQMFRAFIDERVSAQEPDWFDQAVLRKMKRMSLKLRFHVLKRKTGLLWKEGGRVKSWNLRWFMLGQNRLEYYKPDPQLEPTMQAFRRASEAVAVARIQLDEALTSGQGPTTPHIAAEPAAQSKHGFFSSLFKSNADQHPTRTPRSPMSQSQQAVEHARLSLHEALSQLEVISSQWEDLKARQFKGSIELVEGDSRVFVPEFSYKTPFAFAVSNNDRTLFMCADDSNSRREWLKLLRARVNKLQEVRFRRFLQDFYLSALLTVRRQHKASTSRAIVDTAAIRRPFESPSTQRRQSDGSTPSHSRLSRSASIDFPSLEHQ